MTGSITRTLCMSAAVAITALLQTTAMAATQTAAKPAVEQLDEFVVKSDHLWQIRRAIVEAENRFYARYNELNTNDDFDVECAVNAALGSRIASRRCEIHFYDQARQEAASAALGGYYAPDAELVYLERIADYRNNALKIINSDLQLRKLARKREDLGRLYIKRQKEVFKDRWIAW
jgi:hypothetical protein